MRSGLSWGLRKRFYEQASAQLENERPLTDILLKFRDRLKRRNRPKSADMIHQVWRRVRNGDTLVHAMGESLTDLERSVLGSGEQIGNLPLAMNLILEVRERTGDLKWKLIASFFPPLVYLISIYLTLLVIGSQVVPQFLDSIPLRRWTGWAYVLYLMGEVAVGWSAPIVIGGFAIAVGLTWWALPRWTGAGRAFFDRYVFGYSEYRELTGFTWLISYAALLRAKVPDTDALASQIRTANPWLASRLRPILLGIRNGMTLDEAMRRTGFGFPSLDLIDEVGAYVGNPDFSKKIEAVARQYAKTLERRLLFKAGVMAVIFTGLMFFAAVVVQLGSNSLSGLLSTTFSSM